MGSEGFRDVEMWSTGCLKRKLSADPSWKQGGKSGKPRQQKVGQSKAKSQQSCSCRYDSRCPKPRGRASTKVLHKCVLVSLETLETRMRLLPFVILLLPVPLHIPVSRTTVGALELEWSQTCQGTHCKDLPSVHVAGVWAASLYV